MTDLATYRAAAERMDIFEMTVREGNADLMIETAPDNTVAWRIYERGEWIAELNNGHHWMILDKEEHTTEGTLGRVTLADLEAKLHEWMNEEYGEMPADAEAAYAAAEAEAHGLTDAPDPFDAPETSAFPTPWNAPDETLHALARAMMATRPDLRELSLDEWAVEHHDRLSPDERAAAAAIVALFYSKRGA